MFGYTDLLPNQASLMTQMESFYVTHKLQKYGLPLNSRKTYTKRDWETYMAGEEGEELLSVCVDARGL